MVVFTFRQWIIVASVFSKRPVPLFLPNNMIRREGVFFEGVGESRYARRIRAKFNILKSV